MKTDYQITGKLYKRLEAFTPGNCTQSMPAHHNWYYFGSSEQFKSCKAFVNYLTEKHKGHKFKACKA